MHAFHTRGLAGLQAQSRCQKHTRLVPDAAALRALLHERPRALQTPQHLDTAISRRGLLGTRSDRVPRQY